jgi:hypothetical protein
MSKMGSHCPFGHPKHKLWLKERSRVKLAVWLSTAKNQESTQFPCVQVMCDTPLERYREGLQLCFRLHCDRKSAQEVMSPQSRKSPICGNFGTLTWEFRDQNHLDVALMERRKVYYKGKGGGFPQVRDVVSLVCPSCPWFVLTPKVLQLCTNHFVLVLCRSVWMNDAYHFFLVPSQSSSTPLYPSIMLRAKECALAPCLSYVFNLGLTFEPLKELGMCHKVS